MKKIIFLCALSIIGCGGGVKFTKTASYVDRVNEENYFFLCFIFNRVWGCEIYQNCVLCGYEPLLW